MEASPTTLHAATVAQVDGFRNPAQSINQAGASSEIEGVSSPFSAAPDSLRVSSLLGV